MRVANSPVRQIILTDRMRLWGSMSSSLSFSFAAAVVYDERRHIGFGALLWSILVLATIASATLWVHLTSVVLRGYRMTPRLARRLAEASGRMQRSTDGQFETEASRAATICGRRFGRYSDEVAVAWLFALIEQTPSAFSELTAMGCTTRQLMAVDALTKMPNEGEEEHLLRLKGNVVATRVKIAYLEAYISSPRMKTLDKDAQERMLAEYMDTSSSLESYFL